MALVDQWSASCGPDVTDFKTLGTLLKCLAADVKFYYLCLCVSNPPSSPPFLS